MQVVFSDRAYAAVLAETAEKIKTETGGLFLGACEDGVWYVVESIDPGPRSVFEVAYFEYDQAYTQHLIRKVANLYEQKLELIGLWHRHPGSFDIFSSTDDRTNAKYAAMRDAGAVSALVNVDPAFRITMYHVQKPCRYQRIGYAVGDEKIPEKYLRLKTPARFGRMMRKTLGARADLAEVMGAAAPRMQPLPEQPGEPAGTVPEALIDTVLDDLAFLTDERGLELEVSRSGGRLILAQPDGGRRQRLAFFCTGGEQFALEWDGRPYRYECGLIRSLCGAGEANEREEE